MFGAYDSAPLYFRRQSEMYEELLKTLRDFTPFSIIVSAVVIFVVFLCVFVIFSFAKREKRIEQLRWNKVSNHMMLRDVQTNEWISSMGFRMAWWSIFVPLTNVPDLECKSTTRQTPLET